MSDQGNLPKEEPSNLEKKPLFSSQKEQYDFVMDISNVRNI